MRWRKGMIYLVCLLMLLAGCNLPDQSTPTVNSVDFIRTAASLTLDAVSKTIVSPVGTPGGGVTTPGQATPAKSTPTSQGTPMASPMGKTATPTSATATPPCDQVSFIRDISIPDGTLLQPGVLFTKVWELKNSGSCPWNSTYQLVFANEGDLMGGAVSKPLITSGAVQPGEIVQVSIDLKAPIAPGDYKSHWKIRNPAGTDFGPAGKSFWAAIKVSNNIMLSDNLCNAEWRNGSSNLPCPGKSGDALGAVYRVEKPRYSDGYEEDEAGFQLEPQQANNGVITGVFPPFLVSSDSPTLLAIVSCAYGATKCDARMALYARPVGGAEVKLGEWNVVYKNEKHFIKINLADKGLAGKAVIFRFYVHANGSPDQDRVVIVGPSFAQK